MRIHTVNWEKFADRGLFRDSAERTWHMSLEKRDDDTEYTMLAEQDRETSYGDSPVASEGSQGNLTPAADPIINNLLDSVDDN